MIEIDISWETWYRSFVSRKQIRPYPDSKIRRHIFILEWKHPRYRQYDTCRHQEYLRYSLNVMVITSIVTTLLTIFDTHSYSQVDFIVTFFFCISYFTASRYYSTYCVNTRVCAAVFPSSDYCCRIHLFLHNKT